MTSPMISIEALGSGNVMPFLPIGETSIPLRSGYGDTQTLADAIRDFQSAMGAMPEPLELPSALSVLKAAVVENVDVAKERPSSTTESTETPQVAARNDLGPNVDVKPAVEKTTPETVKAATVRGGDIPVAADRPSQPVTIPATSETVKAAVVENVEIAKDLPQPVEMPMTRSDRTVAVSATSADTPVSVAAPIGGDDNGTIVATPETLKATVAENVEVAAELPRPIELPATPETLKATIAQNVEVVKELPRPVEMPMTRPDRTVAVSATGADTPVSVAAPVGEDAPRIAPPSELASLGGYDGTIVATPATVKATIAENVEVAAELPHPVELPATPETVKSTVTAPVGEDAPRIAPPSEIASLGGYDGTIVATPETVKVTIAQNAQVAAELPRPVELPATTETVKATIALNAQVAAELPRPVELPATPETVKAVIAQNAQVAAELPRPVELPATPETEKATVTAPVGEDAPRIAPPSELASLGGYDGTIVATPETLKAAVAQNEQVAAELPRPVELPATPETVKATIAENVEVAKDFPQPVELPATPETLKATIAQNVEVAKELPQPVTLPATPETVKAAVAENVQVAAELPRPVEIPATPKGAFSTTESTETPQVAARSDLGQKVDVKPAVAKNEDVADEVKSPEMPKEMPALPIAFAEPQAGVTVATVDVTGVLAVAGASVAEKASEATAASVLIEAAAAVADTIQVTPALAQGEGEIRIQLKPDVLEGSSIRMAVKDGVLTVDFQATAANVIALVERCQEQLVQALGERVQGYRIAVNVKRSLKDEIV